MKPYKLTEKDYNHIDLEMPGGLSAPQNIALEAQKKLLEYLFSKCDSGFHDGWPGSELRGLCPHCIANLKKDFALQERNETRSFRWHIEAYPQREGTFLARR